MTERTGPTSPAQRDRELFDRVAERYCRKDLHAASSQARRLRLEQTLEAVSMPPGGTILELGCGAGFAARYLDGRYGRYVGIDHSERLVDYARAHNGGPGRSFVAVDADDFTPDDPVDLVLMVGFLHHVDDLRATLERASSWLRPGAFLVANEPQPANAGIRLARRIRKRLDADYSDDQRELSEDELTRAFQAAGLVAVSYRAQGLLSTPFAEVALPPEALAAKVSSLACRLDRRLEARFGDRIGALCWNGIVRGQRPEAMAPRVSQR